jgi:hypothetical protein
MRHQARFQLTLDDHLALRRYLIVERGLGRDQLRASWRRVVVINSIMGLLVGAWVTASWGPQSPIPGPVGLAIVFVLAVSVYLAISATLMWVVRTAAGGKRAEVDRVMARVRAGLEAEPSAAPTGEYTVTLHEQGITESLGGDERDIPWAAVAGSRTWNDYAMIDLCDGLALAVRLDALDDQQAFISAIEQHAADAPPDN